MILKIVLIYCLYVQLVSVILAALISFTCSWTLEITKSPLEKLQKRLKTTSNFFIFSFITIIAPTCLYVFCRFGRMQLPSLWIGEQNRPTFSWTLEITESPLREAVKKIENDGQLFHFFLHNNNSTNVF